MRRGPPDGSVVKNLPCNAGDAGDAVLIPGSGQASKRRKWRPVLVFLPEKSHGQRSLVGCKSTGSQKEGHD